MVETAYFCSAEWHLKRFMGNHLTLAALLYPFALSISHASGEFFCSGKRLARYFGCNPTTLYDAIGLLEYLGFFEHIATKTDCRKVYKVLTHAQWAKQNPGQCAFKTLKPKNGPLALPFNEPTHHGDGDLIH